MAIAMAAEVTLTDLDSTDDEIEITALPDGSCVVIRIGEEPTLLSADDLSALIHALISVDGYMERARAEQPEVGTFIAADWKDVH